MSHNDLLRNIFLETLDIVKPQNLIKEQIKYENNILDIGKSSYTIKQKITLLGSGKASSLMAKGLHDVLKDKIKQTILIGQDKNIVELPNTLYIESSHPIPSQKSLQSAKKLVETLQSLGDDDFFIYLLSGGNSSLVELPEIGISLDEFQQLTDLMLKNGLPIEAINCIRKHISQVKGGKLSFYTKASGIVLVLSDVLGDKFEDIGSAPLYFDSSTYDDATQYLHRYKIWDKTPKSIQKVLQEKLHETPKKEASNIKHFLLASNTRVLKTAKNVLEKQNFKTKIYEESIYKDVDKTAQMLQSFIVKNKKNPGAYIFGGEATVKVTRNGKGGRNQHLALLMVDFLKDYPHVSIICSATDGRDGNSDACGAIIDATTSQKAIEVGISSELFINNFDSNSYFKITNNLITTGLTNNNLLDIIIILIDKKGEKNG